MANDVSYFKVNGEETTYSFNDADLEAALDAEIARAKAAEGDLDDLDTTAKDSLVAAINEALGTLSGYVPTTRKVNNKALSSDITLAASDVGAVPTTRTVNGKALSGDITLAASDVGAAAKINPTIIYTLGSNTSETGTPRVEFRRTGNTGSYGISMVYYAADGTTGWHGLINADGSRNWVLPSETIQIAHGGTGGTSVAAALANLFAATESTSNLNTITTPGLYYISGTPANSPEGSNGLLVVIKLTSSYLKQFFFRMGTPGSNDGNIYTRTTANGGSSWGSWWKFTGTKVT